MSQHLAATVMTKWPHLGDLLASMGFNGVQEASFPIFGTDESDPVQSGVIRPVLVRLHLRKSITFPTHQQ